MKKKHKRLLKMVYKADIFQLDAIISLMRDIQESKEKILEVSTDLQKHLAGIMGSSQKDLVELSWYLVDLRVGGRKRIEPIVMKELLWRCYWKSESAFASYVKEQSSISFKDREHLERSYFLSGLYLERFLEDYKEGCLRSIEDVKYCLDSILEGERLI